MIVYSEACQDGHRYLKYCFRHEPSADYRKGTCLSIHSAVALSESLFDLASASDRQKIRGGNAIKLSC